MYGDFDFERFEPGDRLGAGLATETGDFPGRPQRVSAPALTLFPLSAVDPPNRVGTSYDFWLGKAWTSTWRIA
jgi:hypothetical protein